MGFKIGDRVLCVKRGIFTSGVKVGSHGTITGKDYDSWVINFDDLVADKQWCNDRYANEYMKVSLISGG